MDNTTKCRICGKDFNSDESFHKHLKAHKMTQCEYYQKFYPRYDKYDHQIIRFKNKNYYFEADFNSKGNLKRWISSVSIEIAKLYVIKFIEKRKQKKNLIYALSQVELRTLMVPGMKFISEKFGNYNEFSKRLGLKMRFMKGELDERKFKDISRKFIFTDSREQKALEFDNRTRVEGMSFGDYRMKDSSVFIERKSLGDAWGTLTGGYERFEREIVRAKEANAYLVILVEDSFENLEKFPEKRELMGRIKIPVEFLYHNIRELMQKYQHIQFLFVKNRDEASRIVQKIFSADDQIKDVDLQFIYDIGKL